MEEQELKITKEEYLIGIKDLGLEIKTKEISMLKTKIYLLENLIAKIVDDLPEHKAQLANYLKHELSDIRLEEERTLKEIEEYRREKGKELSLKFRMIHF